MATLVIMESPAKAKTVQKYLGQGYHVVASVGHIRDLPKTLLGVDIEHGFRPRYVDIPGKSALIRQLKGMAAESDRVILATDPDREGEAISWHLAQVLDVDAAKCSRVTFNEITKTGVAQGMKNPRSLDMNMVNAQQARRILDRIVGYKISPFLWKKIRAGLSAGRVQSATVNLVVEREEAIRAFVSEEYWTIDANLAAAKGKAFPAKLYSIGRNKAKLVSKEQADAVLEELKDVPFTVQSVKHGTRQLASTPPFITSTMQQEASRKLGFAARRTMKTAQELYEGVEVAGEGAVGLITYMRTDSLRISDDARREGTEFIRHRYGERYLPEKARVFKTKNTAQDAHEAIRPTMPSLTPDEVKDSLTADQYKLYKLIWERFIASLMANSVQDTCQLDIAAGRCLFKASGYTVAFDGYTVLYEEGKDENEDEDNAALPPLQEGDALTVKKIKGNQHFTQPPARYTEATLIKTMEENGIGRPSTFATTVGTILAREYVEREGKALKPTPLGEITTGLMREKFPEVVDVEFTANMEQELDEVETGKNDWVSTLDTFYQGFAKTLATAERALDGEKIKVPDVESDVVCDRCGRKMVVKSGRYGKFLACPGYPDCKNTKRIVEETGALCPRCGGVIVAKRSQRGRKFYGCSNYPKCDFVVWNEPSAEKCPRCDRTLFKKKDKNGESLYCLTEGCGYTAASKKENK